LIREAMTLAALRLDGRPKVNDAAVFPGARDPSKTMRADSVTHSMQAVVGAIGIEAASPHDLRRTASTLLTSERLRVSHFIRSLVLSHTTNTGGGAAVSSAHYDRNSYIAEKRAALTAWEGLLLTIVGERAEPSNVTALRAGGAA
jgi:integrase